MEARFDHVTVRRRGRTILDGVTFDVHTRAVHALLGHNGAGKTTLLRALVGLIDLSSGHCEAKSTVAVVFTGRSLPGDISVATAVEFRRRLLGTPVSTAFLAAMGVDEFLDRRVGDLSTGMAQRVEIALALLSGAQTLVLDEPTTGLDPQGVSDLLALLRTIHEQGRTIILCSHDLSQLELICDTVTCLRGGRVTAHGSVEELALRVPGTGHILRTADDTAALDVLEGHGIEATREVRGVLVPSGAALSSVVSLLDDRSVNVREVHTERGLFHRIYQEFASAPAPETGGQDRAHAEGKA